MIRINLLIGCTACGKSAAALELARRLGGEILSIDSMKIYRTAPPYTIDEMMNAVVDTIRANRLEECYIRPIIFRGYGELGVNPAHCPLDTVIAVWGLFPTGRTDARSQLG